VAGLQSSVESAVAGEFAALESQADDQVLQMGGAFLAASASASMHKLSKLSRSPNHGYAIYDAAGVLQKWGISGRALNKNGTSPRGNGQVNALNRDAGGGFYCVVIACFSNRQGALNWEQRMVDGYRAANGGVRPPLQKRP
jgi:hypothetical protein